MYLILVFVILPPPSLLFFLLLMLIPRKPHLLPSIRPHTIRLPVTEVCLALPAGTNLAASTRWESRSDSPAGVASAGARARSDPSVVDSGEGRECGAGAAAERLIYGGPADGPARVLP